MPIKEESFRIGCGRYLQKTGVIYSLGDEVMRHGSAPLVIGGRTALSVADDRIKKSLDGFKYEIVEHTSSCNVERATELAELSAERGYDVIVGVGGGVLMDFAKLVASIGNLPVINIPTSSATCAAYTPLSVCYTPEGRTVGSRHFQREVDAVLVDTEIIAAQPTRLLLSGIFDALAKYLEIKQRFDESAEDYPLGLDWAYVLSKKSFSELVGKTEKCISDMKAGVISNTLEQVIFTAIATTGVISGIARGSNQCALAHKFYEATRKMYFEESREYLHGEIVGIGLLLQNFFNNDLENNDFLLSLMKNYNMPHSPSCIGLSGSAEMKEKYYETLKGGSAINEENPDELIKLRAGLDYLFNV